MRHGNTTREEAIELVGAKVVEALDSENCEATGRLQCDGDEDVEFAASMSSEDGKMMITAYYYVTP
jgi:hypothetical protein